LPSTLEWVRHTGGWHLRGKPTIWVATVDLHGGGRRYSAAVCGVNVPGPNAGDHDTSAQARAAVEAYLQAGHDRLPYPVRLELARIQREALS
jgi:hypothetical protein